MLTAGDLELCLMTAVSVRDAQHTYIFSSVSLDSELLLKLGFLFIPISSHAVCTVCTFIHPCSCRDLYKVLPWSHCKMIIIFVD